MYFYEVWVSSQRYHGAKPLTYHCPQPLRNGQVISVPLGNQTVSALVAGEVSRPDFTTKKISAILDIRPLPGEILKLHNWLRNYYPGPSGITTQLFIPTSLAVKSRRPRKQPSSVINTKPLPELTAEQQSVLDRITGDRGSFLLHGETGSGKTRVYLELARQALQSGRSALILTPEIGLTPQLAQVFEEQFPGKVVLIHSEQTTSERRNNWLAINQSDGPLVVIGPRSSLFSPLSNIGLIVIDEAHETSYKQEQMPYYQTTRVAGRLAELHGARLVLGSATPLVQDYYTFQAKGLPILRMTSAAKSEASVTTTIVDIRERHHFSRSAWLSNELITELEQALQKGNQGLIFLNRRGTARLVLCQKCSWQAMCPHCDLPLTYHGDSHHLRCHTCGYNTNAPTTCPTCHSPEIQFKSIGTKTITTEVGRLFPHARVKRFDSDSKKADSLEAQYSTIKEGLVDILVGTQMLSKGLDLPKLAVVGVITADTSLSFPDYTAEERTFQMLRQVVGRVGRGHTTGKVIVQTYYPNSPTIRAALNKQYEVFYEAQCKERDNYHFPPYYFVLKVGIVRASSPAASKAAHELLSKLAAAKLAVEISGPTPAFTEKVSGKYRWQLIIKAKQRSQLLRVISLLPTTASYDIDPSNLL